jgi:3-deoxy-D-manno-octulosonic-acid transferase
MGELLLMCGAADIAFIGGSLIERGGHNPLEPAALGKPVLMGQHVFNFSDICQRLKLAKGLTLVASQSELTQELLSLLTDNNKLLTMGHNAQKFVKSNQGTLQRLSAWVDAHIAQ